MNRKMRLGAGILAAGLLFGGGWLPAESGYAASGKTQNAVCNSVALRFNGKTAELKGLLMEGNTWIPIAFLRDNLKLPFHYNELSKTYSIGQGYQTLNVSIYQGGITSYVNDYFLGEQQAKNINGRIYIPFQWVKNYLGYEGEWNSSPKALNVVKSKENKLTISTEGYDKDTNQVSIHINYPKLSGTGNVEAEKAMNEILKKDAKLFQDSIDKRLKELGTTEESTVPYEFKGSYLVTYNQNGVLSLLTEHYEYLGGAHGMNVRKGYSFSLKDGKLLSLGDLFGENKDYLNLLNKKLNSKLNALPGYFGGFNGLGDQPDFYVQPGGVRLFFQLYEYTPYAAGFPEFTIGFNELLPKGSNPFDAIK
ncbi:PdaC/SigV domain-containing protein [Fontibacillus sp. BL9]|uniref:PdaC/SigV domain-containing protein n=1 Tax=Fontibacillus sp. BL9 TaxID=3389971 RepID=UPI00397AC829